MQATFSESYTNSLVYQERLKEKDKQKKQRSVDKGGLEKLALLGLQEDYQVPFLLPIRYNDCRRPFNQIIQAVQHLDEKVYLICKLVDSPQTSYNPPMTKFTVEDSVRQRLRVVYFGPAVELINNMNSASTFCLEGVVGEYNGYRQLNTIAWVDPAYVGRLQPVYAGKTQGKNKLISPEEVRTLVSLKLERTLPLALRHLRHRFNIRNDAHEIAIVDSLGGNGKVNLENLLLVAHNPPNPQVADYAHLLLRRLAAKEVLEKLTQFSLPIKPETAINIPSYIIKDTLTDLHKTMKLTSDQMTAFKDIVIDLRQNKPMRRLLTGDVGTGKSLPIALAAAVVAKSGGHAVILMPNEPLAEQMRRDIAAWWPDLNPMLVSNSTNKKTVFDSAILVGTTALNYRVPADYTVNLLVIDEQQKMSVNQRLHLAGPLTNVLEASATPMPRSLALIKYGGLPISFLKQAYVTKTINTELVFNKKDAKQALFAAIKETVAKGYQALIIYPLAELTDDEAALHTDALKNEMKSAEGAFSVWDKSFPGRVRFAHGRQKSEEKIANINSLNNNEADILCSTTVVEVGLNVAKLRHVVIVHPERLGLSTLHQIRGRLCRNGGEGMCSLYMPEKVSDKSMMRLKTFVSITDGFKLAMADMKQRGMGDMISSSENEQSGDINMSFLVNQRMGIDEFDWATRQSEAKEVIREEELELMSAHSPS